MASATDIITYIGIPLAVLGVLPILYTTVRVFFTHRRIRHTLLHHGHRPLHSSAWNRVSERDARDGFTVRSSAMTNLLEVELPRYAIAPLERSHELYWKLDGSHSTAGEHTNLMHVDSSLSMVEEGKVLGFLRGGSWRTFHWKKLLVGRKLFRIQYEDELCEPLADVDFSDLIMFLLDWGAIPDDMGWGKLRTSGLWTPGGTVLLRRPEDDDAGKDLKTRPVGEWVLRTTMPDESDGVISLNVRWSMQDASPASGRGAGSLPPGWGRLEQPEKGKLSGEVEQKGLAGRIEELRATHKEAHDSESTRFRVNDNAITEVLWEHNRIETGQFSRLWQIGNQSTALWFTSACSALLSHRSAARSGLWGFEIPSRISSLTKQDLLPIGLLVLLNILPQSSWEAPKDGSSQQRANDRGRKFHERFMARTRAEQMEKAMPEAQRAIARANRQAEETQRTFNDMHEDMTWRQEQDEKRIRDAISSPKIGNVALAEGCLSYLIEQGEAGREWTVEDLIEAVLYLMILDQRPDGEAAKVASVLEEWEKWGRDGIFRRDLDFIRKRKIEFCFAAALVATVASAAGITGNTGADMMECLKLWKKVRLG